MSGRSRDPARTSRNPSGTNQNLASNPAGSHANYYSMFDPSTYIGAQFTGETQTYDYDGHQYTNGYGGQSYADFANETVFQPGQESYPYGTNPQTYDATGYEPTQDFAVNRYAHNDDDPYVPRGYVGSGFQSRGNESIIQDNSALQPRPGNGSTRGGRRPRRRGQGNENRETREDGDDDEENEQPDSTVAERVYRDNHNTRERPTGQSRRR